MRDILIIISLFGLSVSPPLPDRCWVDDGCVWERNAVYSVACMSGCLQVPGWQHVLGLLCACGWSSDLEPELGLVCVCVPLHLGVGCLQSL